MALPPVKATSGTAVVIPGNDIDTDRIIPARFLKAITFDDLAAGLFHDERFDEAGNSKGHPLDAPASQGASVVISGDNFGCGSSREHAPQALKRAGFDAVIAGSFAEIFFGNATTLGMLCVSMAGPDRRELAELVRSQPDTKVEVDIEKLEVRAGGRTYAVQTRATAREALLTGYWDPIGELLEGLPEVRATAAALGHSAG
ncbi:MAG: 3-isopropylmalate dehydratase small subunit [Trueperaceae bacterium]|jgi:3-isopropylmalate/(R)-2-methylmalate dehydratase small subunit